MKPGLLVLLAILSSSAAPREEAPRPPREEITPNTLKAIEKGLDFLASRMSHRGDLPGAFPVASTSLACLAFLAEGSNPHQGRYAEYIRRGLSYIRKTCSKSGFFAGPGNSGMYGHGYATLFVAQAIGMLRDPDEVEDTRDVLRRAVTLLENCQNTYGGWNSTPNGAATDDGSGAIAIMQITALRAARNVGIQVDSKTVGRARKYLQAMTTDQGWYSYNYNSRGSARRSSALTGAGIYMLGAMDLHDTPKYKKGIHNLMNSAPFLGKSAAGDSGWQGWWYYTAFYASLAIYQHGGKEWKTWYPAIRNDLIKKQAENGSWPDPYGGLYTAFALLTLELPLRLLPIFQAGGRGAEGGH